MPTLLGSPEKRGKSDVVQTYKLVGAEAGTSTMLREGLIVGLSGDSEHIAVGGTPKAVTAGGHGKLSIAGVVAGERVWVQADDALATPVVGAQVFVTPAGKVSDTDTGNTAVSATFADAEVRTDGLSTNIKDNDLTNLRCVCISFLGGL